MNRRAEWYQENKERIRAQHAEYYQNNKEQFKAKHAEWRNNNLAKAKAISKAWKSANKDRVNECQNIRSYEKRPAVQAVVADILRMFELFPAGREWYASWLLNTRHNSVVRRAAKYPSVDMTLADYVPF